MNCKKCNANLSPKDMICKECGTPVGLDEKDVEILDVNSLAPSKKIEDEVSSEIETLDINESDEKEADESPVVEISEDNLPEHKGGSGIFIGLALGLMVAVIAVCMVFLFMKKQVEKKLEDNKNQTTEVQNQKLVWNGYELQVPSTITFEVKDNYLVLGNEENTWSAVVGIKHYQYMIIQDNLPIVKKNAEEAGFKAGNAKATNIGNASYSLLEVTNSNQNYLAAYTSATNTNVFYLYIYNTTNTFDYDHLKDVAGVLKTAKAKTGKSALTANTTASSVGLFIK